MRKLFPLIRFGLFMMPGIVFITWYNLRMEDRRYEPHIYKVAPGKVLAARIKGDPDITRETAAVTLFSAGRKLKLSPSYMSGHHLEWSQRDKIPPKYWEIHYSRLVPETATGFADIKNPAEKGIYYERREESEVAEILHLGRYDEIPVSLKKLHKFIQTRGYKVNGYYEEVYLVFEAIESDPGKYETLLRYEVSKQ